MEYKAGFEGKDAMRAKAEKMMGKVASASLKETMPTSAVDKEKPRPFKCGGSVKKYAAGGVGKIRHKQATASGKPRK